MSKQLIVNVYTDGACRNNPGPGGWGAIFLYGDKQTTLSGRSKQTTNNEMELLAVVNAINHISILATKPYTINIHTDSAYVANAINQKWIDKWSKNGWKTVKRYDKPSQPIKNQNLWIELFGLLNNNKFNHTINFIKVKGHSDNHYNNMADALACDEADKAKYGIE